jgi:hypothetical protein
MLASVVGLCADFRRGEGGHKQLPTDPQPYNWIVFIHISRDRLWVGESMVTSCGELGGAGRLQ